MNQTHHELKRLIQGIEIKHVPRHIHIVQQTRAFVEDNTVKNYFGVMKVPKIL